MQALKKKHRNLSRQVKLLEKDLAFDSLAVANLKKQKLALKEKMNQLSSPSGPAKVAAE